MQTIDQIFSNLESTYQIIFQNNSEKGLLKAFHLLQNRLENDELIHILKVFFPLKFLKNRKFFK